MSKTDIPPFHGMQIARIAHEIAAEMAATGRPVIHMEFGQPSSGAPAPALAAAHAVLDRDGMGYWESAPLQAQLARLYAEQYGVCVDPGRIPLVAGASSALVLAFTVLFSPGDRVALARPGYPAYRNSLQALNLQPVELFCGVGTRFQLTADMIRALDPAPAGLIIASPANPTGAMLTREALGDILAVCAARGIRVISDEIYHRLTYGAAATSALEFTDDVIVINSFSKYYSMAGWRLGWLVVPPGQAATFNAINGNLFLTPPSLAQHAALAALQSPAALAELADHLDTYTANRALILERLPQMGLTRLSPPDGAFYVLADVRHLTEDSLALCRRLVRETGVALSPGIDFDPVDGRHFIRLSFAVSTAELRDALDRLQGWIAAQATD